MGLCPKLHCMYPQTVTHIHHLISNPMCWTTEPKEQKMYHCPNTTLHVQTACSWTGKCFLSDISVYLLLCSNYLKGFIVWDISWLKSKSEHRHAVSKVLHFLSLNEGVEVSGKCCRISVAVLWRRGTECFYKLAAASANFKYASKEKCKYSYHKCGRLICFAHYG